MKKRSHKSLKKEAWRLCSLYIRQKYANKSGVVGCVTCPTVGLVKDLQAGHFVPGRGNSVLFEENNIHPQCVACNVYKHGNLIPYYRFMIKKYGEKEVDRLVRLKDSARKLTNKDLEELITNYKKYVVEKK